MRIVEVPLSNVTIKIRETPKELPINRYADFQKYLVQAAGIGSDMAEVNAHFSRLHRFIGAKLTDEAAREAYNLHYNIQLMLNKIDIESIAFACLVDEFAGEKITDHSEQALLDLCNKMGKAGLTKEMVSEIVSNVKKKSIQP